MTEPKRFKIEKDGQVVAYGVQFEGRIVVQDYDNGEPGAVRSIPNIERILSSRGLDESAIEWLDT